MTQSFSLRYRLAIIALLFLISFPAVSHALCEVTLQWDPNNPSPDGYQVFCREQGQSYDYDNPWWQGDHTFTQCTIDQLREDKTYYFVVRAYVGNDTSGDSNEVRFSYTDGSSSLDNSTSSSGGVSGGGGSGGCFISSLLGSE